MHSLHGVMTGSEAGMHVGMMPEQIPFAQPAHTTSDFNGWLWHGTSQSNPFQVNRMTQMMQTQGAHLGRMRNNRIPHIE